jgi:signal transduction histidine kinase
MFHSIRGRLIFSYIFLAAFAVSLGGFLAIWSISRYAHQQEIDYLTANSASIAQQAALLIEAHAAPERLSQLASTAAFFGNFQVRILDANHQVLADSGHPSSTDFLAWLPVNVQDPNQASDESAKDGWLVKLMPGSSIQSNQVLAPDAPVTIIQRSYSPWGSDFSLKVGKATSIPADKLGEADASVRSERIATVPIGNSDQPLGYVELSVGINFGAQALQAIQSAFLVAGSSSILLAGILGLVTGNFLSRPITHLIETTRRISNEDLSVRADVQSHDEIGELADQFNRMSERLQVSFKQLADERDVLRQFISDASHELRTPITALRNFNDLLLGAAADDPQVQAEFLGESRTQIDRLAWITQNLLSLSRLDSGITAMECAHHDLREMIETVVVPYKKPVEDKGLDMQMSLPEAPVMVNCDAHYLEMALSNLLDNAVKYTPSGGQIVIGCASSETDTRLWVKDTGPGIKPEDMPHIFERFYRSQQSTAPGSGLGLSIVQSVVQAHGWKVWAENQPGSGVMVTIQC